MILQLFDLYYGYGSVTFIILFRVILQAALGRVLGMMVLL